MVPPSTVATGTNIYKDWCSMVNYVVRREAGALHHRTVLVVVLQDKVVNSVIENRSRTSETFYGLDLRTHVLPRSR